MAPNVEKLENSRDTLKTYLEIIKTDIDEECSKTDLDVDTLMDMCDQFDNKLKELDNIQSQIEKVTDSEKLSQVIKEAFEFRKNMRASRLKAGKMFESSVPSISKPEDDSCDKPANDSLGSSHKPILPKIQLPKFDGTSSEWISFKDQFDAVVHRGTMPDVSKFVYLRSLLKGEASDVIKGLPLTGSNYKIALELLENRYGRREKLIFSHIQGLLQISIPDIKCINTLWSLQDKLLSNIRALESFGVTGEQYGVILTPLVLSRLPETLRLEWAKETGKESDLDYLLSFLSNEIQRRERSQTFSSQPFSAAAQKQQKGGTATATSLLQQVSEPTCHVCSKDHETQKCPEWDALNLEQRKAKVKELKLCFRCLKKSCNWNRCKAICKIKACSGRHHRLLCYEVLKTETNPAMLASTKGDKKVFMQMARVKVATSPKKGDTFANVFFDTGSNKTYISGSFANKIKPQWEGSEPVSVVAFGSREPGSRALRNIYSVPLIGSDKTFTLTATEIPSICAPLYSAQLSQYECDLFNDIDLKECMIESERVEIDILIGMDTYWSLMKSGTKRVGDLVAQQTVFGWVLSGTSNQSTSSGDVFSSALLSFNDVTQSDLHRFWDLETVGISDNVSRAHDPVLLEFERSLSFTKEGRYEVALPWKKDKQLDLLNNERFAKRRLEGLCKKLEKDEVLKQGYEDYFKEIESSGMIEEVPVEEKVSDSPVFYLPHRPVVRSESTSTKIRPVFDASATGPNSVSLNDCLHSGPNMLPDLIEILIRFRRWPVAFTGDISKAFLQIELQKKDRDVHRFLLPKQEGGVRVMRFKRVTFGVSSSPFLLNATVAHHLNKQEKSHAVDDLKDNLYVDDLLSGGDTPACVCELIRESSGVMRSGGFALCKWTSNDPSVGKMLAREFTDKSAVESTKALGIRWLPSEDCFAFDGLVVPNGLVITKRIVLSFIARLFDPLGFANPFVVSIKILFQELWKLGIDWDKEIPAEQAERFMEWCQGLQALTKWRISRCYTQMSWGNICSIEIHGFADASQSAYGTCVYLACMYGDGVFKTSLVISRARVAPLKVQSLPKLELMAALLCARLVNFVKKALRLSAGTRLICWSDSQVTLAWIKGEPHRWKTFIANRVMEIQELTDPADWKFVPGAQNPADLVTRGVSAETLINSDEWLTGPISLLKENGHVEFESKDVEMLEESEAKGVALVSSTGQLGLFKYSSLSKTLNVLAYVVRFAHNCRTPMDKRVCDLSVTELAEAKTILLKYVQHTEFASEIDILKKGAKVGKCSPIFKLDPFIDESDIIRVGGRIDHSSYLAYEEKHPVIVPKGHIGTLIARFYHLMLKHAGVSSIVAAVRRQYWVVGIRVLAKRVKRLCVPCQKQDALACKQVTAPLPEERITRAPAFSTTGVDHAGPLFCSDVPLKKFYILLFTCGIVRAIHLELVDSLNLFDTSLAMRRFIARRGIPAVIYSDHGSSLRAMRKQMISIYGHLAPQWKHIAPRSPWWGGFYERLVRSVKSALRKTLGLSLLTRGELATMLAEVESSINCRPLTYANDDIDSLLTLSPSDFLLERPTSLAGVSLDSPVTQQVLTEKLAMKRSVLDQFWELWHHEYLKELPKCFGPNPHEHGLKVGSLVLIRESGMPRLKWPLGRVTKLFEGKDKKVRSVELKTANGLLVRSVQLLHSLEVESNEAPQRGPVLPDTLEEDQDLDSLTDEIIVPRQQSRSGRTLKVPNRLAYQ